jgi:hypothetical protein
MKKSNALVLAVVAVSAFFFSSYISGPARHAGYDCTGAETGNGNPTGCSTGNCHGNTATTGVVVTIELDSAGGTPVNKYKGGLTYTVKLTGTNTTGNTDADFGFQITSIKGATPQASPTNAGTWQQTNLPTGVQYSPAEVGNYTANIVEHSTALAATSGSGGTGTVYSESLTWTAPPAGTGTISFYAALNTVIGIDVASGIVDHWNTQSLVLEEDTSTGSTGISAVADNMYVNVYPNPTTDFLQVELDSYPPGSYNVNAYDAEGRKMSTTVLESTGSFVKATINTSNWTTGIYLVQLTNGSLQKVVRVVKR